MLFMERSKKQLNDFGLTHLDFIPLLCASFSFVEVNPNPFAAVYRNGHVFKFADLGTGRIEFVSRLDPLALYKDNLYAVPTHNIAE